MSRACDICGKGVMSGNKVSKSYNHTRRTWRPKPPPSKDSYRWNNILS